MRPFLSFLLLLASAAGVNAQQGHERGGCPQAGQDRTLQLCSFGDPLVLVPNGGDPGGSWFDPFGQPHGSALIPSSDPPGCYTYVVYGSAPCVNDTALVCVTITVAPYAGGDGALTVCGNGAPVDLFAQLNGTPEPGGSWSGPSPVIGGTYDPPTMGPGIYTYTVTAAPCPPDEAFVAVSENAPPDAGISTTDTVCIDAGTVILFSLLDGTPDAGGFWADAGGAASNGHFRPMIDPLGCYTYTVPGMAPCPNANAMVCIVGYDTCLSTAIRTVDAAAFAVQWSPLDASLHITAPFPQASHLSIFSASGQLILQRQVMIASRSARFELDLTGMASGVYTVVVDGPSGRACARLVR